jgi:hypothetical protein
MGNKMHGTARAFRMVSEWARLQIKCATSAQDVNQESYRNYIFSRIMGLSISSLISQWLGVDKKARIICVGLDCAGKVELHLGVLSLTS